jgi:hypothetical protein
MGEWKHNGVVDYSKYIECKYAIITMKPPHIINFECYSKNQASIYKIMNVDTDNIPFKKINSK